MLGVDAGIMHDQESAQAGSGQGRADELVDFPRSIKVAARAPCDVCDPWVRWRGTNLRSESSSGDGASLWKSGQCELRAWRTRGLKIQRNQKDSN